MIATAVDTWGRLDILVNNAGIGVVSDFDEIEPAHLEKVMAVHLMGHIWMCRAAWPVMRDAGYGRIVNTTSGGMWGMPGLTVYGAAKMGIYGLTRGLALEGAPFGDPGQRGEPRRPLQLVRPLLQRARSRRPHRVRRSQPAELVSPDVRAPRPRVV